MPLTVKDLVTELQYLSDRLSTQVRTIALAVLALVWLFLAGGKDAPTLTRYPPRWCLLVVAALALMAMMCDHLQYVSGYVSSKRTLDEAERKEKAKTDFDYTSWPYRLRVWMFWAKQALTFAAVATLVGAIGWAVLTAA